MHIESSQTYALLMSTQGARAASSSVSNDDETTQQQQASTAATTTDKAAEQANNAAATGGMTSKIASETNRALIEQQETSESAHAPEKEDLAKEETKIENSHLWEIANNPDYAAEQARLIGNSYDLPFYPTEYFESFTKAGKPPPGGIVFNNPAHPSNQVQKQRAELYDSLVEKGLPPTEIIMEIYRFNASLPKSYTGGLDPAKYYPDDHYRTTQESNIVLLKQYMTDAADAASSANVEKNSQPTASETKETHEASTPDTSIFDSLNRWSVEDRKLLEAMTGYTVDERGTFFDKNGNVGYPEDLTSHSLRSFSIMLMGARDTGVVAGDQITIPEFRELMKQARASATSLGEKFNEELLEKGLAYLKRSSA